MWSTDNMRKRSAVQLCQLLIFAIGFALICTGCSGLNPFSREAGKIKVPKQAKSAKSKTMAGPFSDILEGSYAAADKLTVDFRRKKKKSSGHVLAASFVNINNLNESSPLGRVLAEQIASRLVHNGFKILEMKLRQNSIYIKEGKGEFLLSREIKEIGASHDSDFVVVGTYAVAQKSIYISTRIVNTADSVIICACDYQLALNSETESLLQGTW